MIKKKEDMVKKILKKEHSNLLIIGGIVISVLFIITIIIFSLLGNKKNNYRTYESVAPGAFDKEFIEGDTMQLAAVFLEVDTDLKKVTVSDVDTGELLTFYYSGGTQITDKYDQLIVISRLEKGQVVKLDYVKDTTKLAKLSVSGDIWENIGITDVKINKGSKIISYLGKNYSYSDGTVVLSREELTDIENILPLDYLTIRGYEENIYSIVVTSGHGYLEFEGEEKFLSGTINVGSQLTQEVTLNMKLAVREGTHIVTLNHQNKEGSKEITIQRDITTTYNMKEFGIEPIMFGEVKFMIAPESASLVVDKEKVSFKEPISLEVGEHKIEVSLGGYVTYHGSIQVDQLGTRVSITLHENKPATTNQGTTTDNNSNDGSGTDYTHVEDNPSEDNSSENDTGYEDDSDVIEDEIDNSGEDTSDQEEPYTSTDETMTIKWTSGAEVYFNGEFAGIIEDGKLTTDKVIGKITVDLVVDGEDTVSYDITVENDGKDAVFSFPERKK